MTDLAIRIADAEQRAIRDADMTRVGSMAEMMLAAGFSADAAERAVLNFTRKLAPEMGALIGTEALRRFEEIELARIGRSIWTVDVEWVADHDSLKAGVIADGVHRCQVMAANESEAELIATQLVAALGPMPTSAMLIL